MARVNFNVKLDKIFESILYLAHKEIELDQYKLVKLFYMADREHLLKYGRPITFDHYVAMENGPVASKAYDISKGKVFEGFEDVPFDIEKIGDYKYIVNPKRDVDYSIFSKSDLKTFDDIVEKYGECTFKELYVLTHDHFAYSRAWSNRSSAADEMRFEDFFQASADKEQIVEDLEFVSVGM